MRQYTATCFALLTLFACSLAHADNSGDGLTAEYFVDALPGQHFQGQPAVSRVEPNINFDFITNPVAGLPATTNFSLRLTGKIQPRYSERYLFMTASDDGVRVIVNGQVLFENWNDHPTTWNWNWIDLKADQQYDIEIDYYQGIGYANVSFWWGSPSQRIELVPQSQLYSKKVQTPASGNYYVSPGGNDSNSGMSPQQAWATVAKVNAQVFQPGDKIYFERGGHYPGSLHPQGSGTAEMPISLGAYGSGALPAIDGGSSEEAVKLFNQQYWNIDSLDITGGRQFGVFVSGDMSNQVLHSIHLTNLTVHDIYGSPRWDCGLIMVAPVGDRLTFDDVLVDGIKAYNTNLWYGIHVGFNLWNSYPTNPPLTKNVVIRNSTVHHVYGDGITVAQSQNVLIEKNLVFETGLAPAGVSYTPNAIWSWQTDNTLIQYNEGYAAHSYAWDGGVFDVDWGSTNTTIQYNYAHDSEGYCVAVMGAHHVTTYNSIVRFNVCANNARKASMVDQGDVFVTTFDGGSIDGIQIYNNTAYWNPAGDAGWLKARNVYLSGNLPRLFMNNIIYSQTPTMIDADGSISMDRNLYWLATPGGTPIWRLGSVVAQSLYDYRVRTGQDWNAIFADPMMNNPTYSGVGRPATAFTLLLSSPAIRAGAYWSGMSTIDFSGRTPMVPGMPDIGANYFNQ